MHLQHLSSGPEIICDGMISFAYVNTWIRGASPYRGCYRKSSTPPHRRSDQPEYSERGRTDEPRLGYRGDVCEGFDTFSQIMVTYV